MAKAKKKVLDVFEGIKYVDKTLNEAAGVKENVKEESFESRLKKRLSENTDETGEKEEITEYSTNQSYDYGYNYDGKNQYLGEDPVFDNDEDEDVDINLDLDGLGLGIDVDPNAQKAANHDMADEFSDDHEVSFRDDVNPDIEEDYDFTEDQELMEALLSDDETPALTPDTTADVDVNVSDVPAPTDVVATGAEAGTPALGAVGEVGVDGLPTDADPAAMPGDDLGTGGPEMDMGGAPAMGGGAGAPTGTADMDISMSTTPVGAPEDIDQLINNLVSPEPEAGMEESAPVVIGENSELKDLGYSDLKDQDLTGKVKMEAKDKTVKTEGEIKLTKLGDKDITGNVKGATAGDAVKHSGTGKRVDPKGEEFTDLGDEDITSGKVKDAGAAKAPAQPKFATVKEESEAKSKALYNLAEKVVDLKDELVKLKFENFKLEKVNTVLTLLPELKQATREKLVEKFDACKSYQDAKKLYNEVSSMVKDFKRGSINEAVLKNSKSTKYLAEGVEDHSSDEDNNDQARKNYLMGMPGFDDQYYGSNL